MKEATTIKTYKEIKNNFEKGWNSIDMIYIFATNEKEAEEQFNRKLAERGWNLNDLVRVGVGYTTQENSKKIKELLCQYKNDIEELKKNRPEFIKAIRTELNNAEFCCSLDEEQTTREVFSCFYIDNPTPYEEECFKEAASQYMAAVFQ